MEIKIEKPPIWDDVVAAGMQPSEKTTIFAYGDAIYNPGGQHIADHFIAHEEVHCGQQGADPDAWWSRYISDMWFRVEQESEAYAKQYDFLCKKIKEREQRNAIIWEFARLLSGPIYGKVITASAAVEMIKKKSKTR